MINIRSIETFAHVAQLLSFRAAAERLHTTQPAVSARIAGLEAALGQRLFLRTTRKVALTPAGRVLLGFADQLSALHGQMMDAMIDPRARPATLRLGCAETIVHTWLPALLEQASGAFPNLAFDIEVDVSPRLRERLLAREIDIAFLVGPLSAPALRFEPLGTVPISFLASPKLGLPRRPMTLAELGDVPVITFARATQPYAHLIDLLRRHGIRMRVHTSASVATIARMALDGLGVAMLPQATVADELRNRRLVVVRIRESIAPLQFVAAWNAETAAFATAQVVAMARQVAGAHGSRPPTRRRKAGPSG